MLDDGVATRALSHSATAGGWRQQKREQTRRRIADAGMRLFLERGFDATTLEAVAAAAGIARRTFFHYFDSKEAVLAAYEHEGEQVFRNALAQTPDTMSPFEAMRFAILQLVSSFGTDEARSVDRLMRSTEALRARKQANYERLERFVGTALADKWTDPTIYLRLRIFAMVGIGTLRIAADRWSSSDDESNLKDHLQECFAALGDVKPWLAFHYKTSSLELK